MSNLQLPTMSYANLRNLRVGRSGKIGYATHIAQFDHTVTVFHHGHPIALITPEYVKMDNCGYHTRTTSDRLHRIAWANGIGRVNIVKGEMIFTDNDDQVTVMDMPLTVMR